MGKAVWSVQEGSALGRDFICQKSSWSERKSTGMAKEYLENTLVPTGVRN